MISRRLLVAPAALLLLAIPAFTGDPEIALADSAGKRHLPLADRGQKATVLFFLMRDCPIANGYAPEIARIVAAYESKGVQFFAVYAGETPAQIAAHRVEYQLPLPGLRDDDGKLAAFAGATVVPEAAIFSPTAELVYRGRIDDRAVRLSVVRPEPRQRDLRLALDAVLAGRKVETRFTQAIGCYLPKPDTKQAPAASP